MSSEVRLKKFEQFIILCRLFGFIPKANDISPLVGRSVYVHQQKKLFSSVKKAYVLNDTKKYGRAKAARINGVSTFYIYQS